MQVKIIADSISPSGVRLTTFQLKYPRFIHSELMTHRVFSRNASSCLTGDTLVYIEKPSSLSIGQKQNQPMRLDDIVNKWFSGDSKGRSMVSRLKSMKLRHLNESTGKFDTVSITNCFVQGKQDVYEITLADGKKLKCTDNHRIYTEFGWMTLSDMGLRRIGTSDSCAWNANSPKIAVNGITYSTEFFESERDLGKTLKQICEEQNYNEKSARWFCEKNKITFAKTIKTPNETFEYLDKQWLIEHKEAGYTNGYIAKLCNTTEDRVKKSCKNLGVTGYTGNILSSGERRLPWNKGLSYTLPEESLYNVRLAASKRVKVGSYKSYTDLNVATTRFIQEVRKDVLDAYGWKCAISENNSELELHHLDPVWHNPDKAFDINNLIPLTKAVHRFIHSNNLDLDFLAWMNSGKPASEFVEAHAGLKRTCDDIRKPKSNGNTLFMRYMHIVDIKYVGVEDTYDLEVEGPHHNFIANGIVVHNSRAIPVMTMLKQVWNDPATPVSWGKNKSGMQADTELQGASQWFAKKLWGLSGKVACVFAYAMTKVGLHKQVANRILEPWQYIHVVLSATEFSNFFELRNHPDAQPEIQELAKEMQRQYNDAAIHKLKIGEWHLPYIQESENNLPLETLKKVSAARCCRVSYLKHDGHSSTLAEDINLHDRLVNAVPPHMSPVEHQAVCTDDGEFNGNFYQWKQYRKFLEK